MLIEEVNEFNDEIDPVTPSIESILFFKSSVVVAILELKLPIEELKSDVVVATLELNEPILVDTEELNVE